MKGLLSLLLIIVVCWCLCGDATAVSVGDAHKAHKFLEFVSLYKKPYVNSPEEYAIRQQIFFKKLDYIEDFNNQQDVSFKVGINEYADLTDEEYASKLHKMDYTHNTHVHDEGDAHNKAPPASLDWRTHTPRVVGPVRKMGQCDSSGAISVIDAISSEYSVQFSKEFYSFNTTYYTDCNGSGCNGGTTDAVWTFIKKFGLQWKYTSKADCPTRCGAGICVTGPSCVSQGDEDALLNAVATKGPVSITIDASLTTFQLYTSGVYNDPKCSATRLDHALLLVGYGSSSTGQDYWIARNEWGTGWGMNGDILIARNKNNMCGIATDACFATTVQDCACEL